MTGDHSDRVLEIFGHGIRTRQATFEIAVPTWDTFDAARLPSHRFVAIDGSGTSGSGVVGSAVVGWVACSPVSRRPAYAGVVEHSVYVHPDAAGRGVGGRLLDALISSTEAAGIWTVQSGVFPENTASLRLHETRGFRLVGVRERIGRLDGAWRDVVLIERRSPLIA